MGRAVIYEQFGGPEVLEVRTVPEPHAGPSEVRVRVTAAGLNPMDNGIVFFGGDLAAQFGITLPSGFGYDFAGVVDEVGDGVDDLVVGDRVFGGAIGRAVADHLVVSTTSRGQDRVFRTPDGVPDEVAATLPVAGNTAAAALHVVGVQSGDTLLVGGAAGGVGVFVIQLARMRGAKVLGTCSATTFDFLRALDVEPVEHGPGLAARLRDIAPDGITAAVDLIGLETAEAALELGVASDRICTIAAGPKPPHGIRPTWGWDAPPGSMDELAGALAAGRLRVPIAATFRIDDIHAAVTMLGERHVHGKIVISL